MTDSMTFRGLRLDHPTADLCVFIKTHGRDEHSPFLEPVAGWGLIVIGADGIRRDSGFNIETFEGRSHKALMPVALAALASTRSEEHVHFISDHDYFVKMLNEGAEYRAANRYRRRDKKPYADADLWREFDAKVIERSLRISGGRPISEFAHWRLDEASRMGSRSAKRVGEKPQDWAN